MLSLKGLKVVIFDWDNTLANTRDALVFSINEVLEEYNMPEWEVVKELRNKDLSFRDNFANIFGSRAKDAYEKYSEVYKKKMPSYIKKPDGADEVLSFLKQQNKKLAIMTNKDRTLFELEYPFLYKNNLFDKIVCGREAKRDKPFSEHAFYTLDKMLNKDEINRDTVWIVGDSHQDAECALSVNALPILVGKPIFSESEYSIEGIIHFNSFEDFSKEVINIVNI